MNNREIVSAALNRYSEKEFTRKELNSQKTKKRTDCQALKKIKKKIKASRKNQRQNKKSGRR